MSKKRTNIDYSTMNKDDLQNKIDLMEATIKECEQAITMAKMAMDELMGANEGRVGKMFSYDEDSPQGNDEVVDHNHVFVHKREKPEPTTYGGYNRWEPDTYLVTIVKLTTEKATNNVVSADIQTDIDIPLENLTNAQEMEAYEFESIMDQAVTIIKKALN